MKACIQHGGQGQIIGGELHPHPEQRALRVKHLVIAFWIEGEGGLIRGAPLQVPAQSVGIQLVGQLIAQPVGGVQAAVHRQGAIGIDLPATQVGGKAHILLAGLVHWADVAMLAVRVGVAGIAHHIALVRVFGLQSVVDNVHCPPGRERVAHLTVHNQNQCGDEYQRSQCGGDPGKGSAPDLGKGRPFDLIHPKIPPLRRICPGEVRRRRSAAALQ